MYVNLISWYDSLYNMCKENQSATKFVYSYFQQVFIAKSFLKIEKLIPNEKFKIFI